MITARLQVAYEGDWTAETAAQDVFGQCLAYTSEENRSYALICLVSADLEETIETVRSHRTVTSLEVVDRTGNHVDRTETAVLLVRSKFREIPPLESLTYEGFFPISNPSIEDGRIHYDLVFADREEFRTALDLLQEFGSVSVEYVSEEFHYHAVPPVSAFEALAGSISARQLDSLVEAVRVGYFDETRDVTMADVGSTLDISDTAVSNHLRETRKRILEFAVPYLNYARDTDPV